MGCFLIFLLGVGVYSLTAMLPLFYQTLDGLRRHDGGPDGKPAGHRSFWARCRRAGWWPKWMRVTLSRWRFGLFWRTSLWNSLMTLDMSSSSLFWPITLSGLALPLSLCRYRGLRWARCRRKKSAMPAGCSICCETWAAASAIAAATTVTERHLQTHRSEMAHALSGSSLALRSNWHTSPCLCGCMPVRRRRRCAPCRSRTCNQPAGATVGLCGRVPLFGGSVHCVRPGGVHPQEGRRKARRRPLNYPVTDPHGQLAGYWNRRHHAHTVVLLDLGDN